MKLIKRLWLIMLTVGTFTDTIDSAQKWKNAGVQYISYSVDVGIFLESCKDILNKLR